MPAAMAPGGGGPKITIKVGPAASMGTGANPRGVAIVVPKINVPPAPARVGNLGAGKVAAITAAPLRTPVQRLNIGKVAALTAPTRANVQLPKAASIKLPAAHVNPVAFGRGLVPGAIKAPSDGGFARVLSTLGDQIIHLPQTTLEGVTQLGVPFVEGIGNALSGHAPAAQHDFGQVGREVVAGVKADPFVQSVEQGSLAPLAQNPLGTAFDLTGAYGAIGKGAGALLRLAPEGSALREVASMAREPRYLPNMGESSNVATHQLENVVGAQARGGSPNVFTRMVQRALDARGIGGKLDAASMEHAMRKGVAAEHAAESGIQQADRKLVIQQAQGYKPAGKDEANAARFIIPYGTRGTGDVKTALQMFRNDIANGLGDVYGVTAKTAATHIKQLDAAIANPNLDEASLLRAAEGYGRVQAPLEERMAKLGTYTQEHMDNATRAQYMQQLPGVHVLEKRTTDPRLQSAVKDAKVTVKEARLNLKRAEQSRAAYRGAAGQRGAFQGARSSLTAVGRAIPTDPWGDSAAALADRMQETVGNLRAMLEEHHPAITARQDANVALRRAELKDATKALTQAKQDVRSKKLLGTLIEDASVPALKKGPLAGLRVRPITEADYQAALSSEPTGYVPSHLTARNLLRDRIEELRRAASDSAPHLAEAGHAAVTGEAAKVGDLNPGWGGVVRSQLNTVNALRVERELQNFMGRWADPQIYGTLRDAQRAADAYHADTGIRLQTVTWKGGYRNVPKAALDELTAQFKADNPGRGMRLLTKPNAVFSRTVLPFSPKLPIMHNIENPARTLLMEKGNAPRVFLDIARHRNTLKAAESIDPELATRMRTLFTPGGLSHTGVAAVGEDAGRLALEQEPVHAAAQRFLQAASSIPRGIITIQRALEKPAQYAALGAHERTMLQEWGHSWADANANVSRYAEDLAHGLANPAEAQRAAEFMHKVDGQYNAMTARARTALRFVPFGSWYANAAKLVMITLPRDHPLFDALLQDVARHNQAQWNAEHQGLPQDMQASLPVGPNAYLDIGKLTPIGVPNPTLSSIESTGQQLFLPWLSGPALAALAGKGPFMSDLYGPNTPYGKNDQPTHSAANLAALEQIVEEFGGPINDLARIVYGHGGTFYPDSTPALHLAGIGSAAVKPGSITQQRGFLKLPPALDKVLDPFHPATYNGGGSSSSLRAGGSLGGAGGSLGGAGGSLGRAGGALGKAG